MIDVPGGASGLLVRGFKGKEADRLVCVLTAAWSRWSRNCAATGGRRPRNWQGKTHHEERKPADASPVAILALPLTDEELDSLEKRAGDGDIAGRGRPD